MSSPVRVLALVGSTASGKSACAHEFAKARGDVEILCVDSMTVYRGMDIGTAKPTAAEREEVRYHLLDLVAPSATFTVSQFQAAARQALEEIAARGNVALMVGGTGLYGRAVIDNFTMPGEYPELRLELEVRAERETAQLYRELEALDPVAASRIEPQNDRRIVRALEVIHGSGQLFSSFGPGLQRYFDSDIHQVGIAPELADIDVAIDLRYRQWIAEGLIDEVRRLRAIPGGLSRTAAQAVGYKELFSYLDGESDLESVIAAATLATRQLVRRQRAWFRRDPRIEWFASPRDAKARLAELAGGESSRVGDFEPR